MNATAKDPISRIEIASIDMDTQAKVPKSLAEKVRHALMSEWNPSKIAATAWEYAHRVAQGIAGSKKYFPEGMKATWQDLKQQSPVVVVFKDDSGALFLAEGRALLEQAQRHGESSVQAMVLRGARQDAIAHSLKALCAWGKRMNPVGVLRELNRWAATQALQVAELATLTNDALAAKIGAGSRELFRTLRMEVEDGEDEITPPPGPDRELVADLKKLIKFGILVANAERITRRLIIDLEMTAPAARQAALAAIAAA